MKKKDYIIQIILWTITLAIMVFSLVTGAVYHTYNTPTIILASITVACSAALIMLNAIELRKVRRNEKDQKYK